MRNLIPKVFYQKQYLNKFSYRMSSFREEKDTFGPIQVPSEKLWGAQTQRSLQNFDIARDTDRMPRPLVRAFGVLKKSAARANLKYGLEPKIGTYKWNFS